MINDNLFMILEDDTSLSILGMKIIRENPILNQSHGMIEILNIAQMGLQHA